MPGWRLRAILSSDGQRVLHEHGFDAPLRRVGVALVSAHAPKKSGSQRTQRWRGADSNFQFR